MLYTPDSEQTLLERAFTLTGHTLSELAHQAHMPLPPSLHRAKGWIGQLFEILLGATSHSLPQPDFVHLGIELKTLPLGLDGTPRESTYICTAPIPPQEYQWETSRVRHKLAKVLWFPVESTKNKPLGEWRVGYPILWSPSPVVEQQLKQDWEELTELMTLGHFDKLSAYPGHFLQIRPKAPHARSFIRAMDEQGNAVSLIPKGFYARTTLTQSIIKTHLRD